MQVNNWQEWINLADAKGYDQRGVCWLDSGEYQIAVASAELCARLVAAGLPIRALRVHSGGRPAVAKRKVGKKWVPKSGRFFGFCNSDRTRAILEEFIEETLADLADNPPLDALEWT